MTDDRRGVAALLLVAQSGLELLAALGLYTFARFSNATAQMAGAELIAFGGPLLALLMAVGVTRGWRAARIGVYLWEGLTILGTALSILVSNSAALTFTVALTGLALPCAIIFLVRRTTSIQPRHTLLIVLLATTGLVHLSLAQEHGNLFLLDAAALFFTAFITARRARPWRGPTALLLLANVVAYLVVIIRAQEAVDDLGIATKSIELAALGLVLWPRDAKLSLRWLTASAALVTTIVLSGGVAWAATMRPGAGGGHTHFHTLDGKTLITAALPTDQQRADAAKLVEDTRAGIERFTDVRVALADGYVPGSPTNGDTVHYSNQKYVHNGAPLDPTRPAALVYANTPNGPMLLGAMYMMPKANERPPDIGGSLAEWHTHANLCFLPPTFIIDGFQSPFGTCPVGSINAPTPAMLHVWTVANPAGPFSDLPPAYVARLVHAGGN